MAESYPSAKATQAPRKDPLSGVNGIRDTTSSSTKDVGDARTLGPIKAARVISPTREVKNFKWNTRKI